MSLSKIGGVPLRLVPIIGRSAVLAPARPVSCLFRLHLQKRCQHNGPPRFQRKPQTPVPSTTPLQSPRPDAVYQTRPDASEQPLILDDLQLPHKVRYLRPAIWALVVSGGIFTGLAYLQARQELKPKKSHGWHEAPQWGAQRRGPPTPTELATQWWAQLNPISKLSSGIIATNTAIHLSSFVIPQYWNLLWHMPARNVNYSLFSSMFVHSGPMHLFFNMYFTYNFMIPVGYSRAFEGNPYHVLSFFLATGTLSGFAQHWATLITPQKRAIPEIFIRCGGASGALLGMMGVFCMQYPTAGLGIMFVPIHFDAQYVLPAIMLFDFIGMVRGYSFVNFGHAAHLSGTIIGIAYSYLDGKNKIWNPLVNFWRRRLQQRS
ncbi:hypothetical protein CC86DRAFT_346392 [Ophiobolus disseminans]|uniref:Peptidase S54 rhomboid domain-containing protein n=1 Tax=Ophiobolus disseminans TaxID=1469910 RepID=A0A6A7A8F2_9PLEO|nr:hypothetical protein CC86DRAFT_346392 [Ophiobolus disseminans]